jgi:hypothetical protein
MGCFKYKNSVANSAAPAKISENWRIIFSSIACGNASITFPQVTTLHDPAIAINFKYAVIAILNYANESGFSNEFIDTCLTGKTFIYYYTIVDSLLRAHRRP